MPKAFLRIMVALMIPCLVADPTMAVASHASPIPARIDPMPFDRQALSDRVEFMHRALQISAYHWHRVAAGIAALAFAASPAGARPVTDAAFRIAQGVGGHHGLAVLSLLFGAGFFLSVHGRSKADDLPPGIREILKIVGPKSVDPASLIRESVVLDSEHPDIRVGTWEITARNKFPILAAELEVRFSGGHLQAYHVLFRKNRPIAIFPHYQKLPDSKTILWMDLVDYYAGSSGSEPLPTRDRKRDSEAIRIYENAQSAALYNKQSRHHQWTSLWDAQYGAYREVHFNRKSGSFRLNPGDVPDESRGTLAFIRLPSVYPSGDHTEDEGFYSRLYRLARTIREGLRTPRTIYEVGPGLGINLRILQLFFPEAAYFASGKNPFEVANTRLTMDGVKTPIRFKVHDGILSPRSKLAFPGWKFDLLVWDLPDIDFRNSSIFGLGFKDLWDAHFTQIEFTRAVDGLHQILSEDGIAVLWQYSKPGVQIVQAILEEADFFVKIFSYGVRAVEGGTSLFYVICRNTSQANRRFLERLSAPSA